MLPIEWAIIWRKRAKHMVLQDKSDEINCEQTVKACIFSILMLQSLLSRAADKLDFFFLTGRSWKWYSHRKADISSQHPRLTRYPCIHKKEPNDGNDRKNIGRHENWLQLLRYSPTCTDHLEEWGSFIGLQVVEHNLTQNYWLITKLCRHMVTPKRFG